jgi:hypothetical protein
MNMRWAWTLPVLTTLATALVAAQARAQGGPAPPWAGAPGMAGTPGMTTPQQAAYGFDPAMMAAMQAQAAPGMYAPPAGYQGASMFMPPGAFPQGAAYPQGPMYQPNSGYPVQPVAYMAGAQVPGPVPAGPMPDVYGSYGSLPSEYGPPGGGAGAYGPPGYGPEAYGQPMQGAPGYGGPGYGAPGNGGPMYGGQMGMGGPCQFCGGQGCENCRGGIFGHGRHGGDGSWLPNGLLGDVLGVVAPYPDGGCAAPRWFDFAVDYLNLKRDNTGRNLALTSRFPEGLIVLETDDLDFGSYRSGFRFTAAMQLAAANSLEFNYFGQFHFASTATVRSPNDELFSVISGFGLFPPQLGFPETDQSDFQQIRYTSEFDSFEINWRCRWMAPNCRYQGSWSLGVRHFILDEKFRYETASSANRFLTPDGPMAARARFDTDVTNNLTGLQIGTDLWICLLPGLRAGGELQAGVYGNHMNINNTIGTNRSAVDFVERLDTNDVSFIGQANLLLTYRINYQWTLRGGYQFLFVEGVALAPENFNTISPFVNAPRPTFTDDDGNVFYHGWNVGLEFMW